MTTEIDGGAHAVRDVSDAEFRAAVGRFATGVTVITATRNAVDFGATVSAFSSVSNDPPTVLACLNRSSETSHAVQESGHFVVNVLSKDQGDVAMHFARKGPDKFAGLAVGRSLNGVPMLLESHMAMECRVIDALESGTHTVFIGLVSEIAPHPETQPLTYHCGTFGLFSRPSEASVPSSASGRAQMAAYATWFGHHDTW